MAELPPRPDLETPWSDVPAPTWSAVEAIPVFFMAVVIGGLVGGVIFSLVESCASRFLLANLVGEAVFVAVTLVWILFVGRGTLATLGLPRRPLRDVAEGAVAGGGLVVGSAIAAYVTVLVVTAFLGHEPPEPEQVDPCVRGTALLLLAPVVILGAPIGEELFFRGFLFRGLRKRLPFWPAALISAVAFGLVHIIPESARQAAGTAVIVPALVVVGLGLAFVYERRKSLLAPMVAHAVFNVVGFVAIVLSR